MIAGQWCNHDVMDQPALQGRIEIAHCSSIEIDDTTGCEQSNIIYFNDDLPTGALYQGIPQFRAMANPAKPSTQI
jgi:hypothetical protein